MLNHISVYFGVIALACASLAFGGSLTPPSGAIAPTPGPEPRIAINTTNTPGDADSIYRIAAPGSYYITGKVTGVSGKRGIEIAASGVSIDLMGYELLGVPGSLEGIATSVNNLDAIEVRNGSVRSWGADGIDINASNPLGSRVESIRATANGMHGINVGGTSAVVVCIAQDNTYFGIAANGRSVLTDCVANGNGTEGIWLYSSGTATGCSASGNGGAGIHAYQGCTLIHCTINNNESDGIYAEGNCTISECTAYDNENDGIFASTGSTITGCTCNSNAEDGIQVSSACLVAGNNCGSNVDGIHATNGNNRIVDNHCAFNALGVDVDQAGNFIARNTCSASTFANWSVVAGNVIFVVDATTAGSVIGNSGGVSPGSANPNANYTY